MYDLSHRFPKLPEPTPERVGPGSYNIAGTFGKTGRNFAPFLSSQQRNIFLGNKSSLCQPGPTSYSPNTKERLKGVISMDKGAPRFINVQSRVHSQVDSIMEREKQDDLFEKIISKHSKKGKLFRCTSIERPLTSVPSVPYPTGGKEIILSYNKDKKEFVLQPFLHKTNGHQEHLSHNPVKVKRFRGVCFKKRTDHKNSGLEKKSVGPGPADYDVSPKTLEIPLSYSGKKWPAVLHAVDRGTYTFIIMDFGDSSNTVKHVKMICLSKNYSTPSFKSDTLRYFDQLIWNTMREDLPAPNYYCISKDLLSYPKSLASYKGIEETSFIKGINSMLNYRVVNAKYEPPRHGFNSSSLRFQVKIPDIPGPGQYDVASNKSLLSIEEVSSSAFLNQTSRFKDYKDDTPGPGTYELHGMDYELKNRSRPSCYLPVNWQGPPFGSCVPRTTPFSDYRDNPGPGSYNTQPRV